MPKRKAKSKKKKVHKKTVPSINLYRKVVISFVVLTTILILIVLYFSFVSVKITVMPKPEKVIADFTVEVVEGEDGLVPDQTNGVFFSKEMEGEKEFVATGSKTVSSDVVGRVTIINNYRRPQPLVATTRLLSSDNILLRIKNRVDIPVGGTVDVDVYADDSSQLEGRVLTASTHFTIPGLWPQLQDKIYAEAKTQIKLGENKVTVVAAEDISQAQEELLDQLEMQVFVDLGLEGNIAKAVEIKSAKVTLGAEAGEEVDKFTVKVKATVEGVMFDKENLLRLTESRLRNNLPQDKQLLSVNYDSLTYSVEIMDLDNKTATVRVHLEGISVVRLNSKIFDKDRLKGLTKEQVKSYFTGQPSVESAVVHFFPFWVQRVPQLSDHIEMMVK